MAAERVFLAHAGLPRPGVCSGHYPVLSGFRQRQPAVPRRAPKCLSVFTCLRIFEPPMDVALLSLLSFFVFLYVLTRSYGHFTSPTPSMSPRGIFNKTHLLSLIILFPFWASLPASQAAERVFLAHAGLPRPGLCSGHYPVLAGFWQRQPAVPRRAPKP